MTVADVLKKNHVNFETVGVDEFTGTTANGKRFWIYRAGGACGLKFTVHIEGQNTATACLLRTVLRKLKTN